MPSRTVVVLGAPSRSAVLSSLATPHGQAGTPTWHRLPLSQHADDDNDNDEDLLPAESYLSAHRRLEEITDLYRGAIFADESEEGAEGSGLYEAGGMGAEGESEGSVEIVLDSRGDDSNDLSRETSEPPRLISAWLPTPKPGASTSLQVPAVLQGRNSVQRSFLTESHSYLSTNGSSLALTPSELSLNTSIARLPTYHINPHQLTPLSVLPTLASARHAPPKVTVLVGVLEVIGPERVTLKQGREAGREVGLLKLVVGGPSVSLLAPQPEGGAGGAGGAGNVWRVTCWRECADWAEREGGLRRGDVVLLSQLSVQRPPPPNTPITLIASPFQSSSCTLCYRTLPLEAADRRYRPDLRLAETDRGMECVRRVVRWVEGMAGVRR